MKVNNQISFKSKIQFLPLEKFLLSTPTSIREITHELGRDMVKDVKFFTNNIRTCTGGALYEPYERALGFHFQDGIVNNKFMLEKLQKNIDFYPNHGLLIGAKKLPEKLYDFSIENFQKLKKFFKDKNFKLSYFEQHTKELSQSHFRYSLPEDTWTLCTEFIDNGKIKEVTSAKNLKTIFKKVNIAPCDRLFIGDEEITSKDFPQFFNENCEKNIIGKIANFFNFG